MAAVHSLSDLPIDTTNFAYILFAQLLKEQNDKIEELNKKLEDYAAVDDYNTDLTEKRKRLEKAYADKDKYFLHWISYFLVVGSFIAAILASIIITAISTNNWLFTNSIGISGTGLVFEGRTLHHGKCIAPIAGISYGFTVLNMRI